MSQPISDLMRGTYRTRTEAVVIRALADAGLTDSDIEWDVDDYSEEVTIGGMDLLDEEDEDGPYWCLAEGKHRWAEGPDLAAVLCLGLRHAR